jgi:SAM-dependent methyltransferase/uncharacterized protein YbaR (Trm112 family)
VPRTEVVQADASMRESLLDLLRCPLCRADLRLETPLMEGSHVMRGALACTSSSCSGRWPIVDGVPDFVSAVSGAAKREVEQTTLGFATNWQRYSDVIIAQPALNDELFRDWIKPVQPERFEGRVVLDAGCGMGRWLAASAPHAPRALVGFDYSPIVHAAFRNTRHLKNVHVVRADIFHTPFRQAFDVAYSIGVVHHTPDPEGAFAALLDVVMDDGVLAVWVYGKENNAWIESVVSPLRQLVTSRMPDPALHALSKLLTLQLAVGANAFARAFPAPTSFSYDAYLRHLTKYPRAYLEHIVYDHLVPQLAQYLPREELERWATSRALAYDLSSRNDNSWRLIAARTQDGLARYTSHAHR